MADELQALTNIASKLRIHVIESTNASNSGHPTSCSSIAEILAVLFFHPKGMRYMVLDPQNLNNDKLVLSKGHAAPILYAAWAEAGLFPVSFLKSLRKIDSELEGHPTPRASFVDVATGSLGQGLSAACGMAYSLKYFENRPCRVFTVLGDAECAEGSVWEAANFASFYRLNNLIAIIDVNKLGQTKETMLADDPFNYKKRFDAFGWNSVVIKGHDFAEIIHSLQIAYRSNKPFAIIAQTIKGKDFIGIESIGKWHGKVLGQNSFHTIEYLKSKIKPTSHELKQALPEIQEKSTRNEQEFHILPAKFDENCKFSTRKAFGRGLEALGHDDRIIVLDGDTKNSTMSEYFQNSYPERFIECYIAEQNMVSVGLGLSKRVKTVFISAFSAFFTRAFDQIRLSAISEANVKFVGSHSGVSVGEDGPSQMGMEDLAMFRSIPNSLVLYPCDAFSTYYSLQLAANYKGIAYIRTSRPEVPLVYNKSQVFLLRPYTIKKSNFDRLCVISAGITLHESLKAWEILAQEGIMVRIIDLFCVKPIDDTRLKKNCGKAGKIVITVEDHYASGGIFEAVSSSVSKFGIKVFGLFVAEVPRSGTFEELIHKYRIDKHAIISKVKEILNQPHI